MKVKTLIVKLILNSGTPDTGGGLMRRIGKAGESELCPPKSLAFLSNGHGNMLHFK